MFPSQMLGFKAELSMLSVAFEEIMQNSSTV